MRLQFFSLSEKIFEARLGNGERGVDVHFFLTERQSDDELRSLIDLAFDFDFSVVAFNDFIDDGKPKPRPLSDGLCGEEGFKNFFQIRL